MSEKKKKNIGYNSDVNQKLVYQPYANRKLSVLYFLPLLLIAGFLPLIVYAKYIDLSGTIQALYWTGQQQYLDFFSYWKSSWTIILTIIVLIIYIILFVQKRLPFKNLNQYYIPLGIYAIFVIFSTIFAKDASTALWGFVDMEQGMFVLLSYVLITFLTINFVNSERDVSLFANVFLFLMIVEGIIGVGQYFGLDIFQTSFGKNLIVPNDIQASNLSFSFGPKTIYGTLFNTNFVGSFAALMLPISIALLLAAKTWKQRIVRAIAVILMVFTWIGCNSRAGYLGVAISGVFALWVYRKAIWKHRKLSVGLFALIIVVLIGLNTVSEGRIFRRLKVFNIKNQIEAIKTNDEKEFKFKDITLGQDTCSIKTSREILNFKVDDNKLYFLDENNKELGITKNGKKIIINDKKYSGYKITVAENYPGVTVIRASRVFNFYFAKNGVRLIGSGGRLIEPIEAERVVQLDGLEKLASNRGYIWGRTIPLIKKYIFVGSGPDNFPIVFPQDDVIAKANAFYDSNIVVDKPHNLYLQTAINTGVLSLLSFIVLVIIYIITSLKLYSKSLFESMDGYIGAACFIGIIGYLVAGIFNDSVVSVAPLFWIILGLGISINYRIKNKISQN